MKFFTCKKCEQYITYQGESLFDENEAQLSGSEELCILHCKKSDYSTDWNKVGFLNAFYRKLILFLHNCDNQLKGVVPLSDFTSYFDYVNSLDRVQKEFISERLEQDIVFSQIFFPTFKGQDTFDYSKIIRKLRNIHFNYCEFATSYLPLQQKKLFFQDCTFHQGFSLSGGGFNVLENEDNVLFQMCIFKKDVSIEYTADEEESENKTLEIVPNLFLDCHFEEEFGFKALNVIFKSMIFKNTPYNQYKHINNLSLENCTVKDRFLLNDMAINYLNFKNSVFERKVELIDCNVTNNLSFHNTRFQATADFFNSTFQILEDEEGKASFHRTFFEDAALFKDVTFKEKVNFQFTTFSKITSFKNAKFACLDLEDTVFLGSTNFSNIKNLQEKSIGTQEIANRETARFIKHELDKISNIIDSNKFYAIEMQKQEKELSWKNNFIDKLVFSLHRLTSNNSQDWFLTFFWIMAISCGYAYFDNSKVVINDYECVAFAKVFSFSVYFGLLVFGIYIAKKYKKILTLFTSNIFRSILLIFIILLYMYLTNDYNLDELAHSMNPFSTMLGQDKITIGGLLYKASLAYLIYQFIISIRQNTRRK